MDTFKVEIRGKFIALNTDISKNKRKEMNELYQRKM